mmetsp:Transcript_15003/g.44961  ORF Transcript_15003/g.44961 Transcript_15003/m.44961 type:complete len:215 (+) Transcript_15003:183-827(+)
MSVFINSPLQPCRNGDASLAAGEELLCAIEHCACAAARDGHDAGEYDDWGPGFLRVTSTRVLWAPRAAAPADAGAEGGFSLEAKYVGLHAVTRDPDTFPVPCLYAQLLLDGFPENEEQPAELFFSPTDAARLQDLFAAFSRAAELNPDSDAGDDESDDDAMLGVDADEGAYDAMLGRFDAMLADAPVPALPGFAAPGQFDDAAAEEDDGGFGAL